MHCHRSGGPKGSIPLIGRTAINPLDPIARRAAVARSRGQGRQRVFREVDTSSDEARPENVSRWRSLALDRSEHDGRLTADRHGVACAAGTAILALLVACVVIAGRPFHARAEPPPLHPSEVAAASDPWAAPIAEAAERFAIPERWIRAVMATEGGGDAQALSPHGAIGLMQVIPTTWEALREKYDLGDDPWEPGANILAGAALLRQMHDRYGAIEAMLAAYHAGPQRYDEHIRTGRALPGETVAYVAKIMPMIDDGAPDRPAAGRDGGPSWQRAPLFVARSAVIGSDRPIAADPLSTGLSNSPAIVDLSALTPPSGGLFVRAPAVERKQRQ